MAGKSIKKNYIYNLAYQILLIITPLITAPYVSRVLGADGVGTSSYIASVVSYFVMFATLGLTTFGQREISYVQEDKHARSIVFWETNIIEFVAATICVIAYIVFSLQQSAPIYYLVMTFEILAVIANISWFFQGLEEFGVIVLRNIIFKVISIVFIFTVVRDAGDLIWYMLGGTVFFFINNVTYWVTVPKYIEHVELNELHPTRHIKTVLSLFVPTMAIQIYTVLDKTMIGVITDSSFENGYYEQAIKISKLVLTIVTALGTVMVPRIGFHFNKGEDDKVRDYMYRGYQFVWFLGIPLCFGLMMVAPNFVPWFFGPGYDKVVPLLQILSLLILAIGINSVTGGQYLIPTKRQNTFSLTVIIGAVVNFGLNIVLISMFKSIGAAIASVVAETVIAIIQLIIVRKELSPWIVVKRGFHYYIAGGIMVVVLYFLRGYFDATIIHTFILALIGAIAYFLVLLVMRDQFFIDNVKNSIDKVLAKVRG